MCVFVLFIFLLPTTQNRLPEIGSRQQQCVQGREGKDCQAITSPAASKIAEEINENTQRYTYYKENPKEYLKAAVGPANMSNWVLAGLGTLGSIFGLFTLLTIKRQADIVVAKERARVSVEIVDGLDLEDGPEWTDAMKVVYTGAEITVTNLGGTNAFNVTSSARIVSIPDRGELSSLEMRALALPSVITPSIEPTTVPVCTLLKGIDRVAKVNNKEETLFLIGTIAYEDIFGKEHRTRFKYRWNVQNVFGRENGFPTACWEKTEDGNKAT
jgi:hypothetical protein